MNKLILVLLVVLLASTYAVRMQAQTMNQRPRPWPSCRRLRYLQTEEDEASLAEMCELCFGGDEGSRVQLKEDEGFDCGEIVEYCFGEEDGSSE